MKLNRLLVTAAATLSCLQSVRAADATYIVSFEGLFSNANHPHPTGQFPGDPHFSQIVAAVHNSQVKMWQPGQLASNGIKEVAENGNPNPLQQSIQAGLGGDWGAVWVSPGGFEGLETLVMQNIVATCDHPILSLITMIAPSPDWMAGVNSINLLDANGNWIPQITMDLDPYDAGTDSGADYESSDQATVPPVPIFSLNGLAPFSTNPIARVTIQLVSSTGPCGGGTPGPITVDGDLSDWAGVSPLVNDPNDTPDTIDILKAYGQADNGEFFLALENQNTIPALNFGFGFYLDTDRNTSTGYALAAIGADYLLEGGTLYSFAGSSQSAFQWAAIGPVPNAAQGNGAEWSISSSQLGGTNGLDFIFWGNNSAFSQSSVDLVPDSGKLSITSGPSTNNPPEANSTTLTTAAGQPVSFVLDASDPDGDPLTYNVGTPASGTLQGTPPNLTYTPNPGFTGSDQFSFTVSDGEFESPTATVTINVEASSIVIDGDLSDWSGVNPLATDPADASGTVDLLALYARMLDGQIYLAFENEGPIPQLNYGFSWYLDTDLNPTTGYSLFTIGADYLLEGDTLYQFAGTTQNSFQWSAIGTLPSGVLGNTAELALDPALIGGATSFDFLFWGPSQAFGGSSVDTVPNAGSLRFDGGPNNDPPIVIDGDFSDWPASPFQIVDGDDLPGTNAVDVLEVRMHSQDGNLYVGYINETPLPALSWSYSLFLDPDNNSSTGFLIGSIGADYLLQDQTLYQYAGSGGDWAWTAVSAVALALSSDQVEAAVPLGALGSPLSIRFLVLGDNAAFGSPDGVDSVSGQFDVTAPQASPRLLEPVVSGDPQRPTTALSKQRAARPLRSARSDNVRRQFHDDRNKKNR